MFNKTKSVEFIVILSLLLAVLLSACVPLQIADIDPPTVEMIVQYDPAQNELPEGIALDSVGNVYVSLAPLGEVRQIAPDGIQTVVTTLDPEGGFGLLGLAVDDGDNVYAALGSNNAETNGVYRVTPSGESTHLAGTEAIAMPNAIAFDPDGNVYITDTILGAVWRVPIGGEAEIWIQDALLEGTEVLEFGVPLGTNGIAYRQGALTVASMEKGQMVRIPINNDSSAGTPEVLIADEMLVGSDGVAFDETGDLFVVNIVTHHLLKIDLSATGATAPAVTILADAEDGLDNPGSLAFGTSPETSRTIYLTNFALISEEKHPGVVTYALNE